MQKVQRTTLVSELQIIGINRNGSVYYTAFIYVALEGAQAELKIERKKTGNNLS